jgi:TPR repeat protein
MGVEANLVKAYVWFSMAARQELADIRNIWGK